MREQKCRLNTKTERETRRDKADLIQRSNQHDTGQTGNKREPTTTEELRTRNLDNTTQKCWEIILESKDETQYRTRM